MRCLPSETGIFTHTCIRNDGTQIIGPILHDHTGSQVCAFTHKGPFKIVVFQFSEKKWLDISCESSA